MRLYEWQTVIAVMLVHQLALHKRHWHFSPGRLHHPWHLKIRKPNNMNNPKRLRYQVCQNFFPRGSISPPVLYLQLIVRWSLCKLSPGVQAPICLVFGVWAWVPALKTSTQEHPEEERHPARGGERSGGTTYFCLQPLGPVQRRTTSCLEGLSSAGLCSTALNEWFTGAT